MTPATSVLSKKKRRQPETGPQHRASIVKKSTQASGARKRLRLQNKSQVPPTPQRRRAQPIPTPLVPISQTACTKRKRSRDSEAEAEADESKKDRPAKQPRKSTPPSLKLSEEQLPKGSKADAKTDRPEGPSEQPHEPPLLSEKDSQSLQSLYKKVMDRASSKSLKRTLSRHSIAQSDTGSDRTQRSSNNNAVYRRQNLAAAKIRLHAELPDNIETSVKDIINAKFPKQRRAELDVVAKEFR